MANIRKFYLENSAGARFPLQGERGVWFTRPEGLGFEMEAEYLDLGEGFFSPLFWDEEEPQAQAPVLCELVCTPPAYRNYQAFVNWALTAADLELVYVPWGTEEYRRRVCLSSLGKGELTKTRLLQGSMELLPLGPWRRGVSVDLVISANTAARYPLRYPFRYGQDAAGSLAARLAAAGHIPGGVRLRYAGGISDPEIRVTGARSGTVYGLCSLEAQIPSGAVLEYSSCKGDAFVRQINADGSVLDLLSAVVNPGQQPFGRLPIDEDCVLTVQSAAPFSGSATLEVDYYYRTV